ncbi:DUF1465 family protein [Aurantiacibacter luteus]|uniref:Uncharacterized protein n=1 Tax=Aurantiacibacter luteus TaxID=1581420 RepID=A0A0G9MP46_9SPHN|nr:DUF1465 family protein [Aurantiacibacter luteus]KLE32364.1 hypothetical protein AAW00_13005 [Aurantiacibacter luteus]
MSATATITPAIVEALYEQALCLAEEARLVFDDERDGRDSRLALRATPAEADRRVVLGTEALRTTTRMMHALAWLLNHRAYFAGEMSEFQLRRFGRLPPPQPESDPADLLLLDTRARDVVDRSRRFYARVARLDSAWRAHFAMQPAAVHRLRERLGAAFG